MATYLDYTGLTQLVKNINDTLSKKTDTVKDLTISGQTITVSKADGTSKTLTTQDNDTHSTTHLVVTNSDTSSANAEATNGNVYLNLFDDSTLRNSHRILGSGAATVSSDANGVISINSTDTKVTSSTNHYSPSENIDAVLNASNGTLTDIANSTSGIQVVTGLRRDDKGHVVGVNSVALKATNNTYTIPTELKNPNSLTLKGNGTDIVAYDGSTAKSLDIVAGTNVTVTSDATNGKITIASVDTKYTHPTSGVTDNSIFTKVKVNSTGHVIEGSSPTTIAGYGITDAYTKSEVDTKLSSVYKYKGTISSYASLPTSGQVTGDVYNIETADTEHSVKAGDNVAWNGSAWDVLSGIVNLSDYVLNSSLANVAKSGSYDDLTNKPTSLKNPNSITLKGAGTDIVSYDGSSAKSLDIVAGSNVTITPDADNNKITIASSYSDTKVTSVGNHYTPTENTDSALSASGGTLTDIANSSSGTQVVTGLKRDAKGHVVGVTSVALKATNNTYTIPTSLKNPNALTLKGAGTSVASYDGSAAKALDIVAGSNVTVTADATNGKITIASTDTNTDTKVTSVGNHYTPAENTSSALSASDGTLTDIANSSTGTQVVTGLKRDAKGHVVGVTSVALKATNNTYTIPTSLKNPNALTLKGAGTSVASYDGSAAKALDIVAGSNVTVTADATNGKITIASTDTNTHYASKNVVGSTSATSNTTSALTNGNVYLNSVENGSVTSTHKISGSGATSVTTDASGNIVISSTDNNTTYSAATNGGLTLSGTAFSADGSRIINNLSEGTSSAQRDDYLVAQYAGGGTTTTTYHRRKLSNIFSALNKSDVITALGYTPPTSDTDTTYSAGTGLSLSGTTFNHSNSITASTAGTSSATSGSTLAIPYITYDAQGHITGSGTHTHTVSGFASSNHTHSYLPLSGGTMTGAITITSIKTTSGLEIY